MSRVPGTFRRPTSWLLIPNPGYAGKAPRPLKAACHDGTPFVTVQCRCGYTLHLHESQLAEIPADGEIGSVCRRCAATLVFPGGFFQAAFQNMRDEGWIDE